MYFAARGRARPRRRYVKPIMFSAGIGQLDGSHAVKGEPEVGMWVVKVSVCYGGRSGNTKFILWHPNSC